jgi:hypothetical protein
MDLIAAAGLGATLGGLVVAIGTLVYQRRRDRAALTFEVYCSIRPGCHFIVFRLRKHGMTPVQIRLLGLGRFWPESRAPRFRYPRRRLFKLMQIPTGFPRDEIALTFDGQVWEYQADIEPYFQSILAEGPFDFAFVETPARTLTVPIPEDVRLEILDRLNEARPA